MFTEGFNKCRERFNEKAASKKYEVASGAIVTPEGDVLHERYGYVCHAFMSIDPRIATREKKGKEYLVISSCQEIMEEITEREALPYINWLINDSPYSEAFLTKDALDCIKNSFVLRTDIPNNLLVGALIATRYVSESPGPADRITVWNKFVDMGMPPNIAFLFCHLFKMNDKGVTSFQAMSDGHSALTVNVDWDYIVNFVNGIKKYPGENYNNTFSYTGVSTLWGKRGEYYNEGNVVKFCRGIVPQKKGVKVNLNIFRKIKVDNSYIFSTQEDYEELVRQIVERVKLATEKFAEKNALKKAA